MEGQSGRPLPWAALPNCLTTELSEVIAVPNGLTYRRCVATVGATRVMVRACCGLRSHAVPGGTIGKVLPVSPPGSPRPGLDEPLPHRLHGKARQRVPPPQSLGGWPATPLQNV